MQSAESKAQSAGEVGSGQLAVASRQLGVASQQSAASHDSYRGSAGGIQS